MDKILEALKQFMQDNDEHWTADGAPRIDVVEGFLGEKTTRGEVSKAAPKFNRASMDLTPVEPEHVEQPSNPWQSQDKAEQTGDGESAAPTPEPEHNVVTEETGDSDAEIYAELEAAREEKAKAETRYDAAMRAVDGIITRDSMAAKNVNQASNVKAFQKQQFEQRLARSQQQKLLHGLVNGSK